MLVFIMNLNCKIKFEKYLKENNLEDKNIDSITLTVFDSNIIAKKLYEKLGFKIDKVIERPNLKYIMKRTR